MSFTFSGTYTQNEGDAAATGTVALTHDDGTTATETLDEDGHYSSTLSTGDGRVKVVETLDGVPVNTFFVQVTQGATVDTGRDLGRVGFSAQTGASVDWSAVEADSISLTGDNQVQIQAGDDHSISLSALGTGAINLSGGDSVNINGGAVYIDSTTLSFFNATAVPQPTGVAVTAEAIHAALVALGLITGP